jgi:hypothetical protein
MTSDNASNNTTLIRTLSERLNECDAINHIVEPEQATIRCLPHVIHLAVQAGLVELKAIKASDIRTDDTDKDLPDVRPLSEAEAELILPELPETGLTDRQITEEQMDDVDYSSIGNRVRGARVTVT